MVEVSKTRPIPIHLSKFVGHIGTVVNATISERRTGKSKMAAAIQELSKISSFRRYIPKTDSSQLVNCTSPCNLLYGNRKSPEVENAGRFSICACVKTLKLCWMNGNEITSKLQHLSWRLSWVRNVLTACSFDQSLPTKRLVHLVNRYSQSDFFICSLTILMELDCRENVFLSQDITSFLSDHLLSF